MSNWTKVSEVPRHLRLLRTIIRHWPGHPAVVVNATIRDCVLEVGPNSIVADTDFINTRQQPKAPVNMTEAHDRKRL